MRGDAVEHEAYLGVTVDHLYPDCPALRLLGARRTVGMVDPEGTDICGLCLRRWKAKQ